MTQFSTPKKSAFLAAYRELGMVRKSAEAAQVAVGSHYNWLKEFGPEGDLYRKLFAEAHEQAVTAMEDEAVRRATKGVVKDVFYKGEVCGQATEYSDTLLIFLLKAANPEKYRERYECTTKGEAKVLEVRIDGNWYGNESRLPPASVATPTPDPAIAGPE
jgi:uncharacterized protein YbjQ (UPF0145 family)